MKIEMTSNELEGKWFVDYYNKPQEIIQCKIEHNYKVGFRIYIRGKDTCWCLAKESDEGYVRYIGSLEDCIEYARILNHRQLVKGLFYQELVKGEKIQ